MGKKFFADIWQHYILWIFAFTLIYTLSYIFFFKADTGTLFYTDTDPYTRALRIIDWLQDFQWSEKIFPYGNPLHGFVLHFTRICDIIWLILSLPFMLFMPLKEAIFYGGMLFSPLFTALSITTLFWAIRPYLPQTEKRNCIFAICIILTLIIFNKLEDCFDFCRPDHHSLMAFIFSFNLAAVMRSHLKDNFAAIGTAGILAGCGIWASSAPEGLFVAAIFLAVLCINWIFFAKSLKYPLYYSMALFMTVTMAWLINPPYGGYAVISNSRLSIMHCVLCALIFLSFVLIYLLKPENKTQKTVALIATAVLSSVVMFIVFGAQRILAPLYDDFIRQNFISVVAEMKPLYSEQNIFRLPIVVFGDIVMIIWLLRYRLKSAWLADSAAICLPTTIACLLAVRMQLYFICWFAFINAITIATLIYMSARSKLHARAATAYLLLIIFYLYSFYYSPRPKDKLPDHGVVFSDLFMMPQYIFDGGLDALGMPYHSNIEGLHDYYTALYTNDEQELKVILQKHNVSAIYITSHWREKFADSATLIPPLYQKILGDKQHYSWLRDDGDGLYSIDYQKF